MIGLSFSPLGQQNPQNTPNGRPPGAPATPSVPDAIRLLSLRVPSVLSNTASPLFTGSWPTALGGSLTSQVLSKALSGALGLAPPPATVAPAAPFGFPGQTDAGLGSAAGRLSPTSSLPASVVLNQPGAGSVAPAPSAPTAYRTAPDASGNWQGLNGQWYDRNGNAINPTSGALLPGVANANAPPPNWPTAPPSNIGNAFASLLSGVGAPSFSPPAIGAGMTFLR
jgi:hypothetical protein